MVNDKPCDSCSNFDPVLRGALRGGLRDTAWGWCASRSVYPAKEGPGQVFPDGVKRVEDPSLPAKPFIVRRGQVVPGCAQHVVKKTTVSKADLMKKLTAQMNPGRKT